MDNKERIKFWSGRFLSVMKIKALHWYSMLYSLWNLQLTVQLMYLPFFISLYFLNYSQSIPFGTKDPQHSLVCKSLKMSHNIYTKLLRTCIAKRVKYCTYKTLSADTCNYQTTFDSHDTDINQLNPNSMIY